MVIDKDHVIAPFVVYCLFIPDLLLRTGSPTTQGMEVVTLGCGGFVQFITIQKRTQLNKENIRVF